VCVRSMKLVNGFKLTTVKCKPAVRVNDKAGYVLKVLPRKAHCHIVQIR